MSSVGPAEAGILILLLGLVAFVVWIVGVVRVASTPDQVFAAAGQSKTVWVLVVILLGILGLVVYALAARPAVKDARRRLAAT